MSPSHWTHSTRVDAAGAIPLRVRHGELAKRLAPFLADGAISAADLAVLDHASGRFDLTSDADMALGMAFALAATRRGHVGADLLALPDQIAADRQHWRAEEDIKPLPWPTSLPAWQALFEKAANDPTNTVVGLPIPRPTQPFVFQATGVDRNKRKRGIVLTNRMWREQRRLADALRTLATVKSDKFFAVDPVKWRTRLDEVYPSGPGAEQARKAAECVLQNRLSVITGGPGTGKTWGVKRVLAVLFEAARAAGKELVVELAAPTGKAAVRMGQAMQEREGNDTIADDIFAKLTALKPRTVHKLLGYLPHKPQGFRHGMAQRLAADVVVIDEASMVDVSMMRHLAEAIGDDSRLILLGDRDQLASVGAGTVLSDLVGGAFDGLSGPVDGRVIRLNHSFRFDAAARVACVADALQKRGDFLPAAVALLCEDESTEAHDADWDAKLRADPAERGRRRPRRIRWLDRPRKDTAQMSLISRDLNVNVLAEIANGYCGATVDNMRRKKDAPGKLEQPSSGYVHLLAEELARRRKDAQLRDPAFHSCLLDALDSYRVLTAHRRGPRGVAGLNKWLTDDIQGRLRKADLTRCIAAARAQLDAASTDAARKEAQAKIDTARGKLIERGKHWLGQPIMVTRNDYDVGLRNGDVGLVVQRVGRGNRSELVVAFPVAHTGQGERPPPRYIPLERLPPHETALAMTVHKSQGSQFDAIALVLPERAGSPILTRELVYTAITRAKWCILWSGTRDVLQEAVKRDVDRVSGLGLLLWDRTWPQCRSFRP